MEKPEKLEDAVRTMEQMHEILTFSVEVGFIQMGDHRSYTPSKALARGRMKLRPGKIPSTIIIIIILWFEIVCSLMIYELLIHL